MRDQIILLGGGELDFLTGVSIESKFMLTRGFSQKREILAIQVHAVELTLVGMAAIPMSSEIDPAALFINCNHPLHWKRARSEPLDEVSLQIVQVEVIPTIPFRLPNKLLAILQ